jgi:hypothetical protein
MEFACWWSQHQCQVLNRQNYEASDRSFGNGEPRERWPNIPAARCERPLCRDDFGMATDWRWPPAARRATERFLPPETPPVCGQHSEPAPSRRKAYYADQGSNTIFPPNPPLSMRA